MNLIFLVILSAVFAGPSLWAGQEPLLLRQLDIEGCAEGKKSVVTISPVGTDLRVVNDGFLPLAGEIAALQARGLGIKVLINGGFFSDPYILSFFKSAKENKVLGRNSSRSPRACTVFKNGAWDIEQSTDAHYRAFTASTDQEIFCAGPELIRDGLDVSRDQFCKEQFDPTCRPDHTDPGIGYETNVARSASCITRAGLIKFFHAGSVSKACGLTLSELTNWMIAEDCLQGMNHDGGGSANLYVELGDSKVMMQNSITDRPIPVWIAVIR